MEKKEAGMLLKLGYRRERKRKSIFNITLQLHVSG
jgi:hypothetical protein